MNDSLRRGAGDRAVGTRKIGKFVATGGEVGGDVHVSRHGCVGAWVDAGEVAPVHEVVAGGGHGRHRRTRGGRKNHLGRGAGDRAVGACGVGELEHGRGLDGEVVGVLVAVVVGDREGRVVDPAKGRSPGDHEGGGCARRHRGRRLRGHHEVSRIGTANHHAGGAGEVEVVTGGGAEVFDREGLSEVSRTDCLHAKEGEIFRAGSGVTIDNLEAIAEDLDFGRLRGRAEVRQEPCREDGEGGEAGSEGWHHFVGIGWK